MPIFTHSFLVRAPLSAVAEFHRDAQALKTLTPPPIIVQLHHVDPMGQGAIADFTLWMGPFPVRWVAAHSDVQPERGFTDTQTRGPMKFWKHIHHFESFKSGVRISEHIEYEHHGGLRGLFSRLFFSPLALRFLFVYRELATRRALETSRVKVSALGLII